MSQIISKRIDVNYSCFDTGEVNFKCAMLLILKGAYKNFPQALTLFVTLP